MALIKPQYCRALGIVVWKELKVESQETFELRFGRAFEFVEALVDGLGSWRNLGGICWSGISSS
jgi:hypothetical protein